MSLFIQYTASEFNRWEPSKESRDHVKPLVTNIFVKEGIKDRIGFCAIGNYSHCYLRKEDQPGNSLL